jgi:hypothetical protein
MPKTLDDYVARYKDGRNLSELKKIELGNDDVLFCGKDVEPGTTMAVSLGGRNSVAMMAVETPSGTATRIVVGGTVQPNNAETMDAGKKMLQACQRSFGP